MTEFIKNEKTGSSFMVVYEDDQLVVGARVAIHVHASGTPYIVVRARIQASPHVHMISVEHYLKNRFPEAVFTGLSDVHGSIALRTTTSPKPSVPQLGKIIETFMKSIAGTLQGVPIKITPSLIMSLLKYSDMTFQKVSK